MFLEYPSSTRTSRLYHALSTFLILGSVVVFCSYTVVELQWVPTSIWFSLEFFFTAFFSVELIVRFIVCPTWRNFVTDIYNWLEILSFLPLYLELLIRFGDGATSESSGWVSVFRVLRAFKVARVHCFSLDDCAYY